MTIQRLPLHMESKTTTTISPPPRPLSPSAAATVDRLTKLINDHPFPVLPLRPLLLEHLLPLLQPSSSPPPHLLVSSILFRLFSAHALPHKSLELFRFSLLHSPSSLSPSSLPILVQTLSRSPRRLMFPSSAFFVLDLARRAIPSLLSPPSLSALLSPLARRSPNPFEDTIRAFHRAESLWAAAGRPPFSAVELTALLRAFCACRRVADARAAFRLLHSRIAPDTRAFNTLLLGFSAAGHLPSLNIFFHELLLRGFQPDAVTYNIRIDAYCKQNSLSDALQLLVEMESRNIPPTVRTLTTLIFGAGLAGDPSRARKLFDEMSQRGISPDRAAYNALIGAVVKSGNTKAGLELLDEMESNGIEADDVSYYTMLCGFRRPRESIGFLQVYRRMIEKGLVPGTRTVMLLMKFFHAKGKVDFELELWDYMLGKGCCPHCHALDILVKDLCLGGRVAEAYECFKQMVERGRLPSTRGTQLLEEFLVKAQDGNKLEEITEMMSRLKTVVPTAS
ncbi:Pentatricopeptide repeat-containing protein [Apostasia shenzhenica]|uniref:Pentatricopeptide repeat-containing protein n=1 Tax=Apostasia shenzhenica TaxID=1088818 RepID=A0A2I0APU4_9ASPA|nr:Pentatricopeptide repeat-containing protein [Apostasia shenzhenica]